jgi:hypothetical protein
VVERNSPGFRSLIKARAVQGPLTLQRQDENLVQGPIKRGTAAIHQ